MSAWSLCCGHLGFTAVGDPYERALELAESREVAPTVEALHIREDLGAAAARTSSDEGCGRWG